MAPSSSKGSRTLTDFPFTSSERKFALLSQTSLPPPKNGSVCSAAIVERIAVAAPSTLSAAPSIISSPNSPASAGASCLASSAASRFTLASSEPTIAISFFGLLQRRPEIFGGVIPKLFFERCHCRKFAGVNAGQHIFEGLMPAQRIQQRKKARLIGRDQKTHQPLGFIIEGFDAI